MKSLVCKAGIGLVLGVSSLLLAAPASHAGTPCKADICGGLYDTDGCAGKTNCELVRTSNHYECLDCEGDCEGNLYLIKTQQYQCEDSDYRCLKRTVSKYGTCEGGNPGDIEIQL